MNHAPSILPFLAALACAPAAIGQTIVSPRHFQSAEGADALRFGLANSTGPSRTLTILDDMQGQPGTLRGIALRRDAFSRFGLSNESAVVDVYVSTATTSGAAPDATFENNHGADKAKVAAFKLVIMPRRPAEFSIPAPFDIEIPFDQPFAFGGAGPLCVDIRVITRTSSQGFPLDYANTPNPDPVPWSASYGQGCRPAGRSVPAVLSPTATAGWSQGSVSLNFLAQGCVPGGFVSLLVGADNQTVAGVPLPIELPGTASAPSGPCTLYLTPLLGVPGVVDGSGAARWSLGVPTTVPLNGLTLYSQVAVPSPGTNAFDLATTNATVHNVVAPYASVPAGTVIADGGVGPTGSVTAGAGLVMRIDR